MSARLQALGIHQLSVPDRLSLIEEIWDSISETESAVAIGVPDWHKETLDERLTELEQNPGAGSSWDEVKARLWKNA